jgi:5,5'-dehydrodivanillate O-demethylase
MLNFDFAHSGPETLAGRYMRMFRQPVYRSGDLAAGRAVPLRIMKEDFTLYRGRSGAPFGGLCAEKKP